MIKVSVVIPVYNGEAYLHQCLDSVCAQTLEEIEIICVDDGSTDASWQILNEYGEKDSRFRLIRQENQHVAAARNNGLAQAQGEYVIFWDCDDFLSRVRWSCFTCGLRRQGRIYAFAKMICIIIRMEKDIQMVIV